MTCCTNDCSQGRDCPLRQAETPIAAVWTLALISGLMFVGLGISIVLKIFGG